VTRPLTSPIVGEAFHVAPASGPAGRDSLGHILRNGERYLRLEDAAGDYTRLCSACTIRLLNGWEPR
jgi:hypothetical protein